MSVLTVGALEQAELALFNRLREVEEFLREHQDRLSDEDSAFWIVRYYQAHAALLELREVRFDLVYRSVEEISLSRSEELAPL